MSNITLFIIYFWYFHLPVELLIHLSVLQECVSDNAFCLISHSSLPSTARSSVSNLNMHCPVIAHVWCHTLHCLCLKLHYVLYVSYIILIVCILCYTLHCLCLMLHSTLYVNEVTLHCLSLMLHSSLFVSDVAYFMVCVHTFSVSDVTLFMVCVWCYTHCFCMMLHFMGFVWCYTIHYQCLMLHYSLSMPDATLFIVCVWCCILHGLCLMLHSFSVSDVTLFTVFVWCYTLHCLCMMLYSLFVSDVTLIYVWCYTHNLCPMLQSLAVSHVKLSTQYTSLSQWFIILDMNNFVKVSHHYLTSGRYQVCL